jgi:hypothetical protein
MRGKFDYERRESNQTAGRAAIVADPRRIGRQQRRDPGLTGLYELET